MKSILTLLVLMALAAFCGADSIVYVRIHKPLIEEHLKLAQAVQSDRIATLRKLFQKGGCPQVLEQNVPKEEVPNLICVMPGLEDGTIVVGASSDYAPEQEKGPAGWGTLAMLPLLAESLSPVEHRFTIILIAFSGREHGVRGASWYLSQLTEGQRKPIKAMVDLDDLGKTPPVYVLAQSDKTLANWLQVAASSLQVANPARVDASSADQQLLNGAPAGTDEDLWANAKPFEREHIPVISVQSAKPAMLPALRRQGAIPDQVTGTGLDIDAYEDTYRLISVYVLYLDRNLGRPLIEPGVYSGRIIDTAGVFPNSPVELSVKIDRFTTSGELNRFELILRNKGQDALEEVLANQNDKGTYRFGLNLAFGVKLIVLQNSGTKPYVLLLGTRLKPRGATAQDYRFTAIKLIVDSAGNGEGIYYDSVKVRFNKKHELEIEDFGSKPDDIKQVQLQKPALPRTTPATAVAAATAPVPATGTAPATASPAAPGGVAVAASAAVSQSGGAPQATPANPEEPPTAIFQARAQLVQLDVAVTDSSGKPVVGLQQADFTVLEDGKPQDIRIFEPHVPAAKVTAAAAVVTPPPPSLPPHTFTNKVVTPEDTTLSILLIDLWNTAVTDQAFARKQAIEFLKTMPKGKTMAIFVLGSHLTLAQGFTDDPATLVASAEKVINDRSLLLTTDAERQQFQGSTESVARFAGPAIPGNATAQAASNIQTGGSMDFASANARENSNAMQEAGRTADRVRITVEALIALSRSVSSYAGRKNLVWLSGSFPVRLRPIGNDVLRANVGSSSSTSSLESTPNFLAQLRAATTALADARIAVYPIDVRGIQTSGVDITVGAAESASFTGSDNPRAFGQNLNTQSESRFQERSSMKEVAEQTGGEVMAGNDVRGSIGRAIDDGSTYYAIAYTPGRGNTSQEFRKIEVKLNRKGLKLAYRPGYFPNAKPDGAPKTHPLIGAMQPGVPPSTVIALTVEVLPPDSTNKKTRINYTIDIRGVDFAETADHKRRAVFDCIAVAFNRQGAPVGQISNTVDATLPAADYESALKTGFSVRQELELPPGDYDIRMGVMDRGSQKIGTLDAPLQVATK